MAQAPRIAAVVTTRPILPMTLFGTCLAAARRRVRAVSFGLGVLLALTPVVARSQGALPAAGDAGAAARLAPQSTQSTSYITPFPPQDVYRVQIYGDWMAEGLIAGLVEALQPDNRVQVNRKNRVLASLVRPEHEEDVKAEEASREPVQIGVLFFGISDRVNFRLNNQLLRLGSEPWQSEYGRRVDRLIKALKRRGVALYMVGQPPLRREEANDDAKMLTEILREKAFVNGIRFIDIAPEFLDENGDFTQFGPDWRGERQKLREGDGVSMTWQGSRKIAALIEREMRRDLALARAERAVPLAGSEPEQRRINPEKAVPVAAAAAKQAAVPAKDARGPATATPIPAPTAAAAGPATGEQKAETSRVSFRAIGAGGREETVAVEIVRPAISAQVLSLLARKDVTQTAQQNFDLVGAELADGTTLSLIVAPLPGGAQGNSGAAALGAQQSVYNAVWVRGDRLPPKVGRGDDFTWPRPNTIPYEPPQPKATPVQRGGQGGGAVPQATSPALSNPPEPALPRARPIPRG